MDGDEFPTLEQLKQRGAEASWRIHTSIEETKGLIRALSPHGGHDRPKPYEERLAKWFRTYRLAV